MAKSKEDKSGSKNVMTNTEARKKLKSGIVTLTQYMEQIDLQKESIKETIAELSAEFGIDKKFIKKLAATMFKHNYTTLQEENRDFELWYELVIENRVRDEDDTESDDESRLVA